MSLHVEFANPGSPKMIWAGSQKAAEWVDSGINSDLGNGSRGQTRQTQRVEEQIVAVACPRFGPTRPPQAMREI